MAPARDCGLNIKAGPGANEQDRMSCNKACDRR